MTLLMWLSLFFLVLGLVGIASSPSPYFAALGLVVVAVVGCGVLASYGGSFLSLVLLMIYVGGMLVVFAYSVALAAEPYPEAWGSWSVWTKTLGLGLITALVSGVLYGGWYEASWVTCEEGSMLLLDRADTAGVGVMYGAGGGLLLVGVLALLLTLFGVLELTRGVSRGALRAV
uniref:NADH-ubiquinone oxidoreductase chain 6 n=1 Tax=Bothus myriaster TaxID=366894 RepID=A0A3G0Z5S1_BOTMY|nr:NADH dehydrogenase subunit 6 [Bothus myriaster]AID59806.1 NADH dehydrogenase subunit 6 [Bothus myriaster]